MDYGMQANACDGSTKILKEFIRYGGSRSLLAHNLSFDLPPEKVQNICSCWHFNKRIWISDTICSSISSSTGPSESKTFTSNAYRLSRYSILLNAIYFVKGAITLRRVSNISLEGDCYHPGQPASSTKIIWRIAPSVVLLNESN
jgi:hypothetical protein